MKTIALLTGRGNNTLKDKNILDVLGKPLIYYPANAAKKSIEIDDWFCSSEDEKILEIASSLNYKQIKRPSELALPTSQHFDTILHALAHMEEHGVLPEIIIVILANNVTINSSWIDDCINIMKNNMKLSSVIPVYQDNDHHPLRAKKINENGYLEMFLETKPSQSISTNRQDLEPCYYPAHNFWVLNVSHLKENGNKGQLPWGFMGNNISSYVIDESIDIHSEIDLYIAAQWIKENYDD